MTTAWIDASSGVSGDMLLGALADLGVLDPAALPSLLGLDATVAVETVRRGSLRAVGVTVTAADEQPHRRLADVVALIDRASLDAAVKQRAVAVFEHLAAAESRVHGVGVGEVEFHEVGAVDSIVDVVGVCLGVDALGVERVVVSPLALGGGTVRTAHGQLPVPGPAVVELLAGSDLTAYGGPVDVELATPTGVALLAVVADEVGPLPAMTVTAIGVGAGGRDLADRPNALRIVVGAETASTEDDWLLVEANVDDLDPRLWPVVLDRLLEAGAADAWLTPILMKKGRPAHTVAALATASRLDNVTAVLFAESTTIGVRTSVVGKRGLDRDWVEADIGGATVRVKVARQAGRVVNAVPEYADVVAAATATGRPVKVVLAAANAAAATLLEPPGQPR